MSRAGRVIAIALLALVGGGRPDPADRLVTSVARDRPLSQAIEDIADQAGCRVRCKVVVLGCIGEEPVALSVVDARLGDVLNALGEAYDFTWSVADVDPCEITISRPVVKR